MTILHAYPTRIVLLTRTRVGCAAALDGSPLGTLAGHGTVITRDEHWAHIPVYATWKARGVRQTKADIPALAVTCTEETPLGLAEQFLFLLPLPGERVSHAAIVAALGAARE